MIKIGLLGLGTVGTGVYESLLRDKQRYEQLLQDDIQIVKVLVKNCTKERDTNIHTDVLTEDFHTFINSKPDIVFEALVGVDPAYTYVSICLENGISVVSANKELIAKRGHNLHHVAEQTGAFLAYEASVAGGIPIISTLQHALRANNVTQVYGILNGTTNYILSQMTNELTSFEAALTEAQKLGYAEADPTADIDGWDALYKLQILAYLCSQSWKHGDSFTRKGITSVKLWHLTWAKQFGLSLKLIGTINTENNEYSGSVEPTFVHEYHPLAKVNGVTNAITLSGHLVGELTFQGSGAGKWPTASAMLEDFVYHYLRYYQQKTAQVQHKKKLEEKLSNQGGAHSYSETSIDGLKPSTSLIDSSIDSSKQYVLLFWKGDATYPEALSQVLSAPATNIVYHFQKEEEQFALLETTGTHWRGCLYSNTSITAYPVLIHPTTLSLMNQFEERQKHCKARPTAFAI